MAQSAGTLGSYCETAEWEKETAEENPLCMATLVSCCEDDDYDNSSDGE